MDIDLLEAESASATLQKEKVKRLLLEPGADELVLEVLH